MSTLISNRFTLLRPGFLLTLALLLAAGLAEGAKFAEPPKSPVNPAAEASPTPLVRPLTGQGSIGSELASVAATSFQPVGENVVDLATFGPNAGAVALNVPAPGTLTPAPPATELIPEPGALTFGLAILAVILGGAAKSFLRCWRMTSARSGPGRE